MTRNRRRLVLLLTGTAALVLPIFITLALIDYFAEKTQPAGKQIFSLVMTISSNNWSVGQSKTIVTDSKPTSIAMVFANGEPSFSFRTDRVNARKGGNYA